MKFDKLYMESPVWLQNTMLGIYGRYLNKIRYGPTYQNRVKEISSRLSFTSDKIENYAKKQLLKTLQEAITNVSYYQKIANQGFSVEDLNSIESLNLFPLLTKELVRANPQNFLDQRFSNRKILTIHTTGSTGTPLNINCTSSITQENFTFFRRYFQSVGINPHSKRATMWGRLIVPANSNKPPFWRYCSTQKNLLLSSYHLTPKFLPLYIDTLKSFKPDFIDSYPSSIYAIAEFAFSRGISLDGVTRAITTSAETLFAYQREIIEKVFNVSVFDQYGSAEMSVFVGQCHKGSYHVHSDYGYLELLLEDGTLAGAGEEGDVVCTGFINQVMPLIRYRIGDRAVWSESNCSCGLPFPVLKKIIGRSDDVIVTPDGRKVGRLSPVLKGFPVKEAQYIQKSIQEIQVLIVKSDEYTYSSELLIERELRKRLGDLIKIEFSYVNEIKRGPGGKMRSIISNIPKHAISIVKP